MIIIALLASIATAHSTPVHAAEQVPTDVAELETFLDRVVPETMDRWAVPGAVILVVQNNSVAFQKGYGYADVAKQIRMSPETTILHVFSLSKLFTATAVMQLVEQYKLDVDQNVNAYLQHLRIQNPFPQPITIRHLLTHTAGFDSDQREIGGSARTAADWLPLEQYLTRRALTPMWPAGQQFLYTNAAYDVLGLVVEDVSGHPFAEYMSESILNPLAMTHSTFEQASSLASDATATYRYSGGQLAIVPDGLLLNTPAAGLRSTAADMAHFMLAELQDGQYRDARILQPATLEDMRRQRFIYEPDQPGATFGFREAYSPRTNDGFREESARNRVLWHSGGGPNSPTSYIQLQPDRQFGLFIAFNSDEFRFLDQFLREFNDHYDPVDSLSNVGSTAQASVEQEVSRFTGTYRLSDYSRQTISKLLLLQEEDLPEVVTSSGSIGIRWLPDAPDAPEPLVQLDNRVFASRNGQFRFTFLQDDSKTVTGMVWGNLFVLEKVPWYQTGAFQRGLFAIFLLASLAGAMCWPVSALVARLRKRERVTPRPPAKLVSLLAALDLSLHGAFTSFFLLALLWLLPRAFDLDLQFGMPPAMAGVLALPVLIVALSAGLVVFEVAVLRTPAWSRLARIAYGLYTVHAMAFIPFLVYWNLLGQRW
jgi:CubicO group peptidase (beta-lactamase class C family)